MTAIDGVSVLERVLAHAGVAPGERYGLLLRDSRVLCALPADRETARRTLALYQPQRRPARWLKTGFLGLTRLGGHLRFLKSWAMPGPGPPGKIAPGVLVGSSGHLCERAVLVERSGDEWQVVKLAVGREGHEILGREVAMLEAFAGRSWLPRLRGFGRRDDIFELRMDWQEGRPWHRSEPRRLLDLLDHWLSDEIKPLGSFADHDWIEPALERHPGLLARVEAVREARLRTSVRHGDLTRPNLRVLLDGSLAAHDWERGVPEGLPGLDLAHFLVQERVFKTRMGPGEVITAVLEDLARPVHREWLGKVGWSDSPIPPLCLCLALNTHQHGLDQVSLLDALESRL